jgi:alkanesulfonate monooxygenase SsuD/methylene tetrahydromethanopterin reductase-like flavin-dependent oxidoreductase (luciferase family)
VKVGLVVPQGLLDEFAGRDPAAAWSDVVAFARHAESLGVESLWAYDHLGTFGPTRDVPTFEAFGTIAGLLGATTRIRVGALVARAGLRNPALLAKHVATLDVAFGGRIELGFGVGGTKDDAVPYGFDVPDRPTRLERLDEELAVVSALFRDGRATVNGRQVRTEDALLNPTGVSRPSIPLIVAGNREDVARLAVRHADELNADAIAPADAARVFETARRLEADAGRDTGSMRLSIHLQPQQVTEAGAARSRLAAAYRDLGASRFIALLPTPPGDLAAIDAFVADARAGGAEV